MNDTITKNYQLKFDLKQLRAFLEVAKEKSFSKAAENMFISQPAISRKISHLEQALDCQLFLRDKNNISLTVAGEELKNQLPNIFDSLVDMKESLTQSTKQKKVKLGYTCAAMTSFLPRLLRDTASELLNDELVFTENDSRSLIESVLNNDIDGAFIMSRPKHEKLKTINIRSEPLGMLIPDNHRFSLKGEMKLEALKGETLILFPRSQNPSLYDQIIEYCEKAGVTHNNILEADSCNAIFGFVVAERGLAFTADSMSPLAMKGTRYKPLVQPGPQIEFSFITKQSLKEPWQQVFEEIIYRDYGDMPEDINVLENLEESSIISN